jgi:hypothetical protein
MCRLSRNRSTTLLRRMNLLRLWSQYQQGKTRKKLNRCRRTTTMISKRKKTMRKKKVATRLKVKKMKTTPWSNAEKDETFHDTDEIKTFGDEASLSSGLGDTFR